MCAWGVKVTLTSLVAGMEVEAVAEAVEHGKEAQQEQMAPDQEPQTVAHTL